MTGLLTMSQRGTWQRATAQGGTQPRQGANAARARALPRGVAFWTVGAIALVLLAASSAPTPLYPVFQAEFGFSPLMLTVVFAVYVVALLAMLLTVGRLSDHIGRRPVLGAALIVEAGAMAIFLGADSTGWLLAARIVQGLATGTATAVLAAYLIDLQPADGSRLGSLVNGVAPTAGLAVGAAGTGVLVQYGPHPTRLVFAILVVAFVVLAATVAALPESVTRMPGALATLRPRVAVPAAAHRAFLQAAPLMIATWALGGLVLSLGASVLATVMGLTNHALVGLAIAAFTGAGALAAVLARDVTPDRLALGGTAALAVGTGLFLAGLLTTSLPLFLVAFVIAGAGFGGGFLGALRAVTQLAQPHERSALLSAVYVVSYTAFSVPAVVAGVLVTHVGLRDTAVGYGAVVAALAAGTFVTLAARARTAND